jgi:hypothetical protein
MVKDGKLVSELRYPTLPPFSNDTPEQLAAYWQRVEAAAARVHELTSNTYLFELYTPGPLLIFSLLLYYVSNQESGRKWSRE